MQSTGCHSAFLCQPTPTAGALSAAPVRCTSIDQQLVNLVSQVVTICFAPADRAARQAMSRATNARSSSSGSSSDRAAKRSMRPFGSFLERGWGLRWWWWWVLRPRSVFARVWNDPRHLPQVRGSLALHRHLGASFLASAWMCRTKTLRLGW